MSIIERAIDAFGVQRTTWIEHCATQLRRLRSDLDVEQAYMLAYDLWCDGNGDMDPELTAVREVSAWTPGVPG